YYINETDINETDGKDKLTIIAQDSSKNETKLTIEIINQSIYEKPSLYNWRFYSGFPNDNELFLSHNSLYYKSDDTFKITYELNDSFYTEFNIALDFKHYNNDNYNIDNSNLKLYFNYNISDNFIIDFDFKQNKIISSNENYTIPDNLTTLNINFETTSIIRFDVNNGEVYDFNFEHTHNISAIKFKITDLVFSAKINT
ncbi:MAG TPA: hypothetical protein GX745_03380, partial [Clostridiales bacterium]|nr:hypothetical protein [Clostridiales bacterium]